MAQRILLVDDEPAVHAVVRRTLAPPQFEIISSWNGEEAPARCREERAALVLLDLNLPSANGWEVARCLRRDASTRIVPIVMLTGAGSVDDKVRGLRSGADDYLTKPFSPAELKARVERLLNRHALDLTANPLTLLPGGPAIEMEVLARLNRGENVALLYADIDSFKAHNDAHGYYRGDQAIVRTARILSESARRLGGPEAFVGHIGGDDFVLLAAPENAPILSEEIVRRFDQAMGPELSLSIAVASNDPCGVSHYAQLVDRASQVKKALKGRDRAGSAWMKDRRLNNEPAS